MAKIIFILLVLALLPNKAFADQYVRGYTRRNGTYVEGYHRSNPDGNPYNNYSSSGNVNPWTGQVHYGGVNPWTGQVASRRLNIQTGGGIFGSNNNSNQQNDDYDGHASTTYF